MGEDDGLPAQVCLQCVHYISRAFSFKQLCERSESTLRELLGRPIQQTLLELKPLCTIQQDALEGSYELMLPEAAVAVLEQEVKPIESYEESKIEGCNTSTDCNGDVLIPSKLCFNIIYIIYFMF